MYIQLPCIQSFLHKRTSVFVSGIRWVVAAQLKPAVVFAVLKVNKNGCRKVCFQDTHLSLCCVK